jgi:endonuclease/exonuclease/phosphatase family metal-dependent hydrolase
MRLLGEGATFPADEPLRQLDHVLTDDPGLTVRRCDTPLMAISDHRPLVTDIVRT